MLFLSGRHLVPSGETMVSHDATRLFFGWLRCSRSVIFFKNFLFDIFSKQWQLLKLPHWRYERKRNLWSFSFRKGWAIFLSNIPPIHFGWLAEWMHFRRTLCRPGRFGIETFKPVILLIIQQYIGFLQLASNLLLVFLSFCGWHLTPQFGTNCEYWPHYFRSTEMFRKYFPRLPFDIFSKQ